jgi:hypothetical protein
MSLKRIISDPRETLHRGWVTAGGELWNCHGTYCKVPDRFLPRLEVATDDFSWLDEVSFGLRDVIAETSSLHSSDNDIDHLENIIAKAQILELNLPQPFLRFIRDASMQAKVPSCTACFLALSKKLIPIEDFDGWYLLRFLNDSQSCFMWYLCLNRDSEASVLASQYFFEPEIFKVMEYEEVKRSDIFQKASLCSDSFMEFLYRFWIENTIWYSAHQKLPFTPIQQAYQSKISRKL